jgi:hypothetical protein
MKVTAACTFALVSSASAFAPASTSSVSENFCCYELFDAEWNETVIFEHTYMRIITRIAPYTRCFLRNPFRLDSRIIFFITCNGSFNLTVSIPLC